MPTPRTNTENFNIQHYFDSIHFACLHTFDQSTARGIEMLYPTASKLVQRKSQPMYSLFSILVSANNAPSGLLQS
jgi:hypothetical protein